MAETESTSCCWEERLDIDDADFFTIAPSPLRPCSSRSASLLPGPAGALQASMHRINTTTHVPHNSSTAMHLHGDLDADFHLHSWIYALQFLGANIDSVTPIASIRTHSIRRIPMVMGIVKSCKPNGLGDFLLTLKDQTGTVSASIHHKALLEGTLATDLEVGCVFILKQVVVFSPAWSIQYLNITEDNVLKLIRKNCGAPQEQIMSSVATKFQDNGKREENKQIGQQVNGLQSHVEAGASGIQAIEGERVDLCGIITRLNPKANEVSGTRISNILDHQKTRTVELHRDLQDNIRKICGEYCKISEKKSCVKEKLKAREENEEKEKVVSKVSIPEWTDEQLSELFADY